MPNLRILIQLLHLAVADRTQLALENAALRHQVALLKRSVTKPRIEDSDRIFWIMLRRTLRSWRETLHFVKPDTVVRWHRKGYAHYWKKKSAAKSGRPPISMKLIFLIRRLSKDNLTWGAPKIVDELALLGFVVAESTVAKYMVKHKPTAPGQSWSTFLSNHMDVTAACDFFVVPTLTFKMLYVFVVLSHDRRRILNVNVTVHPTAQWTARQLREAFPFEAPRFLLRDQDGIYRGWEFKQMIDALQLEELVTAKASPWQNCYVERVIGTLRRECTDHVIPFGETHLLKTLVEYVGYYNESRTHQSLNGDSPIGRCVERKGEIVATPVLGGLHHRYSRAA